jgi:hypothetical protein
MSTAGKKAPRSVHSFTSLNDFLRDEGKLEEFTSAALKEAAHDLPPKKWTGLSCFHLHADRADVADGRMEPGPIVVSLDEGKNIALSLRQCCVVIVMDKLGLEGVEEGSAACVAYHRATVGSRPAPRSSTQRRNTESRSPSSRATAPTERPLEATRSTACRL